MADKEITKIIPNKYREQNGKIHTKHIHTQENINKAKNNNTKKGIQTHNINTQTQCTYIY